MEFSHWASSVPSCVKERKRKPPPGQMTTAVPVALEASGRNTVSVGCVTLPMRAAPSCPGVWVSSYFQLSDPGAAPGHTGTTFGSAAKAAALRRMSEKSLNLIAHRSLTCAHEQRHSLENHSR